MGTENSRDGLYKFAFCLSVCRLYRERVVCAGSCGLGWHQLPLALPCAGVGKIFADSLGGNKGYPLVYGQAVNIT